MKPLLCLLLALMSVMSAVPVCADAVPEGENVTGLLTVVLNAAKLKDEMLLEVGSAPSQGLQEAAFALDAFFGGAGDRLALTLPELEKRYGEMFASGAYVLPAEGDCPCVTVEGDGLVFALEELYETPLVLPREDLREWIGEDTLRIAGRLYWSWPASPAENGSDPDAVPWGSFEALLRRAPGTRYGYLLTAYRILDTEEGS